MSECCGPVQTCCGGGSESHYVYGAEPFVTGHVDTFAGPVKRISSRLSTVDALGTLRVRLGIRRSDHRVRPALYAVGEPDDASPVLVTGNYKLTFDTVRAALSERDLWLLVIDSRGVNVWCAAGKGTFGTDEVVRMVREVRLEQVVSHTRIVLPQLSATGVVGHEVRARSGFTVVWGPVRACDIPAFLDDGLRADSEMRRVRFTLRDRATLVAVEASTLWSRRAIVAYVLGASGALALWQVAPSGLPAFAWAALSALLAVVAGTALSPLLLPWLPGRTFALKGAVAGAALLIATFALLTNGSPPAYAGGLVLAGTALSSYAAMNFTGSSTYTSPSGVEWEMRRAIPLQVAGVAAGMLLFAGSFLMGRAG
jgi:hypothetical protein